MWSGSDPLTGPYATRATRTYLPLESRCRLLRGAVFPVTLRGMAVKAWHRSSIREDKCLTEDRKSLIERYMIDAAEAQARAERAAEEKARQAEEEARRAVAEAKRAAEERAARRAVAEAKRAVEEEAARRAAAEAKRAARADAAATRTPPAVEPPVADLPVAALQLDQLPVAAPPVAEEAPAAALVAEPRGQAEPELATRLPIYRWFDARGQRDETSDPGGDLRAAVVLRLAERRGPARS